MGYEDRSRSRSPKRDGGKAKSGSGKSEGVAGRWNERGFGFIKPNDGGEDVFCHLSAIQDGNSLAEGAIVYFDKVTLRPISRSFAPRLFWRPFLVSTHKQTPLHELHIKYPPWYHLTRAGV